MDRRFGDRKFGFSMLIAAWIGVLIASPCFAEKRVDERADSTLGWRAAQPEVEIIRLRPGKPPYVRLSSGILYRILVAEIAAQRGLYNMAASTMLNLAKDTGDSRVARRALEFYLASGDLRGAFEAARLWARYAPHNADAQYTELALAAANGQIADLAPLLRQRINQATDKPAALAQALAVLGRLSDRKKALSILDQALSPTVRTLAAAHLALADVAQAAGESERALREARLALAADPKLEGAVERILEYGIKVDAGRVIAEARAFIAKHPAARRVRLLLADQFAERGDYEAALAEVKAMVRQFPEDFDLLFIQAQLAYQAHHLEQAHDFLEEYLAVQNQRQHALVPGTSDAASAITDAHILLSRIAEDQGRYDQAIAELDRIEDTAMRFQVRLRQAILRARQGDVTTALAMIDQAHPADDEERVKGILAKAGILIDAGRVNAAVTLLARADKTLPDTVEIKYELAMLYERQDKIVAAERLLRQVMTLEPEHVRAYNALGFMLADRNIRLPEALALITQALNLTPEDPYIQDSMGWVKYRMGDTHAALMYLQRAYARRPESEIGAHLGEVLWIQGQHGQARAIFKRALKKDTANDILRETIKRLGVTW